MLVHRQATKNNLETVVIQINETIHRNVCPSRTYGLMQRESRRRPFPERTEMAGREGTFQRTVPEQPVKPRYYKEKMADRMGNSLKIDKQLYWRKQ